MKFTVILFSFCWLMSSAAPPQPAPAKLALIIAIGTYDSTTGWKSISSLNDINYIKPALLAQGFTENNIAILKNEQATKAGIVTALDKLIASAKAGDIVVFHFSGHGQQIFDDGKKDEADGYDEALVPYNANMRYSGGYTGQHHLRDDELGEKLKALRKNIGSTGSLLVLLDACHSGTATRGEEIFASRGASEKCEPPGYSKTISQSRGAGNNEGVFDDKDLLSNMVVISAASADQLNYETKDAEKNGVGSLSYAFSRALSQTSGAINYKILFEKIKTDIQSWKPYQHPQIEGNSEQQVLGGKFIATPEIIRISKWNADNSFEIPRGAIHAITKGMKLSIYPVEITDFKNAPSIASGEIIDVSMAKSTCSLSGAVPEKNKAYQVVLETAGFGELSVAVEIGIPNKKSAEFLRNKLQSYSFIQFDQAQPDIAVSIYKNPSTNQEQLQVLAVNDSVLWQKPWVPGTGEEFSDDDAEDIFQQLKAYSRAQFLRLIQTPVGSKTFEYVQIEVIPGIIKNVNGVDSLIIKKSMQEITNAKGDIQFSEADDAVAENEGFVIRIRNLQDYPVYLSVLDIMPDNAISVVIPDPSDSNSTADDFKVGSRQTFTSRPIKLYPPYGKDYMKILITRQPMDLKSIQTRSSSRGAGSSFENFYNDSFKDGDTEQSRGPKMTPVKVDEIKIVPFTYVIVKRGE